MKIGSRYALAIAACVLMLAVVAPSQQTSPSPEEARIEQVRSEIKLLEGKTPPLEAQESYWKNLLKLRQELRDALLEKRGALKKDIRDLKSPNASEEIRNYVGQLEKILGAVNTEIASLTSDSPAGVPPSPGAERPLDEAPKPKDDGNNQNAIPLERRKEREAFQEAVASISTDELRNAADPKLTESAAPALKCSASGTAIAGATAPSLYDTTICSLARDVNLKVVKSVNLEQDSASLFRILIAKLLRSTDDESYANFVTEAQAARTDQQTGAGPGNAGTTSLVVKGGVPYLLGLAVENGAATQSQSGTTLTFRINPVGVLNIVQSKGFITGFREAEKDPFLSFLKKTSIGLSFDTDRGNQPGVFTGDRQQLSSFSARFEFVNERDPRDKKYQATWEAFMANEGVKLADEIGKATVALVKFGGKDEVDTFIDPVLQAWLNQLNERISKVDPALGGEALINAIAVIVREQADLLPVKLVSPQTTKTIAVFAKQYKAYSDAKNELLDKIAKGRVFTVEYTNQRGVNAPDTSNFNFIAAMGTGARVDLTANGSFTLFNTRPAATSPAGPRPGRVRDFQFAGQVEIPFKFGDSQLHFWFSGRYERLLQDAATPAGTIMPNTRGDIAVGQFGLKIPIKSLGIQFPISVTFANRTELVKEREVRGNFGFTFNWDTLWSKLKPF